MKRGITFLLAALTLALASCSSKKALEFNDKMVNLQSEIINHVKQLTEGNTDPESRKKAYDYVGTKLEELKKIEAVSGGEAFKQAMIDDINGLYKVCEYTVKLNNAEEGSDEYNNMAKEQQDWLSKLNTLDNDV